MSVSRREFGFLLNDVARLVRTRAYQEARRFGTTRAQWAVLARIERPQGLKQSELAEMLDLQPITLTRLIDRLCESGVIERRNDPADRRVKRLYLLPAARPLLDRLHEAGDAVMASVLAGIEHAALAPAAAVLEAMRDNLRRELMQRVGAEPEESRRYG